MCFYNLEISLTVRVLCWDIWQPRDPAKVRQTALRGSLDLCKSHESSVSHVVGSFRSLRRQVLTINVFFVLVLHRRSFVFRLYFSCQQIIQGKHSRQLLQSMERLLLLHAFLGPCSQLGNSHCCDCRLPEISRNHFCKSRLF